jgi:DNA invertase Pin-like site-specific DNA recombinase
MVHVLASVAENENELRGEQIRAGQAAAKANGKTWGGSEKDRKLKVTDDQVKVIHRMRAEGEKIAAITRATSLSRPTVYQVSAAATS